MSFINPRRVWWSPLCTFRCSVRWEIRSVNSAIWTSGEPVSLSCSRCSVMMACFSGMYGRPRDPSGGYDERCRDGPADDGRSLPASGIGRHTVVTAGDRFPAGRYLSRSAPLRGGRGRQDATGLDDVEVHLRHQVVDPFEPELVAEAGDEGHLGLLAVEVVVEVHHERLHQGSGGPLVEGRSVPDGDGGGVDGAVGPSVPTGVDPEGR